MRSDSTPHASPACGSEADQAGSFISSLKEPKTTKQLALHLIEKGLLVDSLDTSIATLEAKGLNIYPLKIYSTI